MTSDKEIQSYINKFKAKLGNMLYPDSDKAMEIRKTIGSLLIDLGIPALNFSTQQMGFVLDHLQIPNFEIHVGVMNDKMNGLVTNRDTLRQMVLRDYLNPGDTSEIDETIEDDDFIIPKRQFHTQNIHGETKMTQPKKKRMTNKEYEQTTKYPSKRKVKKNWRVMPRDVLTGDYEHDSKLCEEMIDDLYYIKDNLKGKDSKFFEVVDMISQYTYAIRTADFDEKARIKQEHFDKTHYELLDIMVALTKELKRGNDEFNDMEISMTQKGLDAVGDPNEVSMVNAVIAGIMVNDKEIPVEQVLEECKDDPLKDDFLTQLDEIKHKREKQQDLILETKISGKYTEPEHMKISTITVPTRFVTDEDGKAILFKNLSPEAQKELRSIRAKKAAATRRRNKLSKLDKISQQPGDEY